MEAGGSDRGRAGGILKSQRVISHQQHLLKSQLASCCLRAKAQLPAVWQELAGVWWGMAAQPVCLMGGAAGDAPKFWPTRSTRSTGLKRVQTEVPAFSSLPHPHHTTRNSKTRRTVWLQPLFPSLTISTNQTNGGQDTIVFSLTSRSVSRLLFLCRRNPSPTHPTRCTSGSAVCMPSSRHWD
jgi:hypothetical protein